MKKNLLIFLMLLGNCFWVSAVFAQHDNLINVSAEFMGRGCRNAAIDAADIVVYNPAGLVKLQNGFHINIGNQSFFRKPAHKFTFPGSTTEKSYQQASPDLLLPNIYMAYKKDKYSVYGGFYISGGGGSMDYPDGSINSDLIIMQLMAKGYSNFYGGATSKIEGSSFYMTPIVGFSYAVSEKFSAAVSFRYIMATNKQKANVTMTNPKIPEPPVPGILNLESSEKATGVGAGISINYQVSEKLNVACRYDIKSNLEFETDSVIDNFGLIRDGKKSHRDLPASFAFGFNYKVTDNLSVLGDFNWFFQKQANWDTTSKGKEWSEVAGDVARFGVGLGYDVNDKIKASGYFGYTLYQYDDKNLYYTRLGTFETVKDNNWSIGLGGQYKINDMFNINLALVQSFWKKDNVVTETLPAPPYPTYPITTNNHVTSIAIGANVFLNK